MNKVIFIVWFICIICAALGLYRLKYEVNDLEAQLQLINRSILKEQEEIHTLKAEWNFLASPSRLKILNTKYLNLQVPTDEQKIEFDNIKKHLKK